MQESNHKPVQVVLTYNASNSAKNNIRATLIAGPERMDSNDVSKLDDHNRIIRRYSLDDNGGGYLGL